jgi:hypothetical protein
MLTKQLEKAITLACSARPCDGRGGLVGLAVEARHEQPHDDLSYPTNCDLTDSGP